MILLIGCRRIAQLAVSWVLVASLALGMGVAAPRSAFAMNQRVRTVLVAGAYGAVGGTALGLVSLPITRDSRSLFIGTSLGLYLGVAVGIYYLFDKSNSLKGVIQGARSEPDGAELRLVSDHELRGAAARRTVPQNEMRVAGDHLARVDIPIFSF